MSDLDHYYDRLLWAYEDRRELAELIAQLELEDPDFDPDTFIPEDLSDVS